jgi:hypothetical protein
MHSFSGRLRYFAGIVHPGHIFTAQSHVDAAVRCLQQQPKQPGRGGDGQSARGGGGGGLTASGVDDDDDARRARWTLAGATHPESGALIPLPVRMASWPVLGVFPVSGLMHTAKFGGGDLGRTMVFQSWNQSQNAAVNFANGASAAEGGLVDPTFLSGYVAAVTVALGIAGGSTLALRHAARRGVNPGCGAITPARRWLTMMAEFAPFPAVALANVCNVVIVRRAELEEGIQVWPVWDAERPPPPTPVAVPITQHQGDVNEEHPPQAGLGRSVVAARQALRDTCVTRVALPALNFLLGPLLLRAYMRRQMVAPSGWGAVVACGSVSYVAFAAGVPLSLALFPQSGRCPVDALEPELRARVPEGVREVEYNKGL